MREWIATHSLGVMCAECWFVLVEDNCKCGESHGYGFQEANEWAAQHFYDHPCFIGTPLVPDCACGQSHERMLWDDDPDWGRKPLLCVEHQRHLPCRACAARLARENA